MKGVDVKLKTTATSIRDVTEAAGLRPKGIAAALGISGGAVVHKLNGRRPWYKDELEELAALVTDSGRASVTVAQLVKLAPVPVKVRGFA